ncbi:MAG: stage II sporulation protein M [Solirubrobacterales bacterium]
MSTNANEALFRATMQETRDTLAEWNETPFRVVGRWALIALAIALALLTGVYIVAQSVTPDVTYDLPLGLRGIGIEDAVRPFIRNMLVLALHGFVCVAGFMAMRALPEQAQYKRGINRWVHHHASGFAMVFVSCATLFSIATQIFILGGNVADIAFTLGLSNQTLILTVLPHAIPELTAVFLPLAAFLVASRAGDWHKLLAATVVTVSIAIPVLVVSALIEAYAWPELLIDAVY